MTRKVLVTGGAGFVGQALVEALRRRGDQVRVLGRHGLASEQAAQGVEFVQGDVTQPDTLTAAVEGQERVFHLAGIRRAPRREPFFEVNAQGTRHLCEALVRAGAKARLVLCGSLAAAGPSTPDRPRTEDDPPAPQEWYGESKLEAERIVLSYADRLPVTVSRPVRILGPGDRENLVFFRLVARGWKVALSGAPRPLSLVDVDDVTDHLLLLGERPEALGKVFFCAGQGTLTLETLQDAAARALGRQVRTLRLSPAVLNGLASLADGVSQLSGRHLPLNRKLARQLLAPAWTCSIERSERLLGYSPKWSIDDSITRSAAWYQQRGLV